MGYGLLAIADKTREVSIGEAAFYALLGFAIVFLGIAFLILVVWLVGKVMTKTGEQSKKQAVKRAETPALTLSISEEGVSEETVAVITAAIMAYYQQNNRKCAFTVKRIKRM